MGDAGLAQGFVPFDAALKRGKQRRSGAGLVDMISVVAKNYKTRASSGTAVLLNGSRRFLKIRESGIVKQILAWAVDRNWWLWTSSR